jgi:hypothetical protein
MDVECSFGKKQVDYMTRPVAEGMPLVDGLLIVPRDYFREATV